MLKQKYKVTLMRKGLPSETWQIHDTGDLIDVGNYLIESLDVLDDVVAVVWQPWEPEEV